MNILYICHRIPYPPNKGDKIRSFHQIRLLAENHTVSLVCFVDEKDDLAHVETLKKYCSSIEAVYRNKNVARLRAALAILTRQPLSVAAFHSSALKKRIEEKLRAEKFDRIIVFSSSMAHYVRRFTASPKIMDFVDIDSEKWRLYADYHSFPVSWIYRLEADRLARYEEEVAGEFDHSVLVSEKEADLLRQRVADRTISVIPNGVDLDYFYPAGDPSSSVHSSEIVFTGAMDYFPNVDAVRYFCDEIFPLIRKILPEARFTIVGRDPVPAVRELAHHANVTVTGAVADVRPYLAKANVAVAPFRIARGIQNKVLEAMAMGVPVVGTSLAFQSMEEGIGKGAQSADDPEEFTMKILGLLTDRELRNRCAVQARDYVERRHQWQAHGALLEFLMQSNFRAAADHGAAGRRSG